MANSQEHFIKTPGVWLGDGIVKLSVAEEELKFVTRWTINKSKKNGQIQSCQEVQIGGVDDVMKNMFAFSEISSEGFQVVLENDHLGQVVGQGIYRPELIAWEFRHNPLGFEGFEVYRLLEDGSYFMHAEYVTKEDFRTQIQGRLWKKSAPTP